MIRNTFWAVPFPSRGPKLQRTVAPLLRGERCVGAPRSFLKLLEAHRFNSFSGAGRSLFGSFSCGALAGRLRTLLRRSACAASPYSIAALLWSFRGRTRLRQPATFFRRLRQLPPTCGGATLLWRHGPPEPANTDISTLLGRQGIAPLPMMFLNGIAYFRRHRHYLRVGESATDLRSAPVTDAFSAPGRIRQSPPSARSIQRDQAALRLLPSLADARFDHFENWMQADAYKRKQPSVFISILGADGLGDMVLQPVLDDAILCFPHIPHFACAWIAQSVDDPVHLTPRFLARSRIAISRAAACVIPSNSASFNRSPITSGVSLKPALFFMS